jgi:magnesium-transporting ATPase (P-type)
MISLAHLSEFPDYDARLKKLEKEAEAYWKWRAPMLPKQILLTNLLTDFPEMTIATDSVDPETLERPRRWGISFIRKFMMVFGPLSSVLDYLTRGLTPQFQFS